MTLRFRSQPQQCLALLGALLIVVAGSMYSPAYGQVLYGSLIGTVTDQSQAVVPSAVISVVDIQTGQTRQEISDSGGRYSLVNLLPGSYTVKTVAKGFKTAESNFTITAN